MKQATTTRRAVAVADYGQDASFVANLILTQHSKPGTKLRNLLYLLQSGRSVSTAQFSTDVLLVDGVSVPWSALDTLDTVLDIVNPRLAS